MDSPNNKLICALYLRVSTEDQSENFSLPSQQRALTAYAEQNDYLVAHTLTDDGFTGEDLQRPALIRMRDLVRRKAVNVIVIYEPDRLARKLSHFLLLQDEFDSARVRVEYVTFPVTDNHEGKLSLNMKAVFAEYEKEKIKERTTRGRKEKALQGLIVGGRRTFGYILTDGKYTVCEVEAEVVRMIYRWFTEEGLSIRQIVLRLNARGFKPHTASKWGKSSVHRILSNESYAGKTFYNRRKRVAGNTPELHHHDKKTRHEWKSRTEWIEIAVPQLITEGTFAAAQTKLAMNREAMSGRPARHSWLLSGFIKCAKCGRRYSSFPSRGVRYYRCVGVDRMSTHPCDAPKIKAEQIEECVLKALKCILANPRLLESKLASAARDGRDLDSELVAIEKQLSKVRVRESKLIDLALDDGITRSIMLEKMREIRSERESLEQLRRDILDAVRLRAERSNLMDAAEKYSRKISTHLEAIEFETKRRILQALIHHIVLEGDRFRLNGAVSFHLDDGKPSTTLCHSGQFPCLDPKPEESSTTAC
jgi:site-specific DNA recombinase